MRAHADPRHGVLAPWRGFFFAPFRVDVIANDGMAYKECNTGNDHGEVVAVFCVPFGLTRPRRA